MALVIDKYQGNWKMIKLIECMIIPSPLHLYHIFDAVKLSAFSMCRNAVKLYYPIEESIRSVLPLVDEYVIAVGKGDPDDQTLEVIRSIHSDKIKVIETEWDLDAFPNGTIHAHQSDVAKAHCSGDWLIYLQADEVLHEDDHHRIREWLDRYADDQRVEGFLFQYLHFWGDYLYHVVSHGWYPQEIRLIRNLPEIHSWESAQSFRVIPNFDGHSYRNKTGTRKLRVVRTDIKIYHYGWVRPPQIMAEKVSRLHQIHTGKVKNSLGFNYGSMEACRVFQATHPCVMQERIHSMDWDVKQAKTRPGHLHKHERLKNRILTWIEQRLNGGNPILSFKNYTKIG
jgi:hypothetical protein